MMPLSGFGVIDLSRHQDITPIDVSYNRNIRPILVRAAQESDRSQIAKMRASLWPDFSFQDHLKELVGGPVSTMPTATFVAHHENGPLIGFLEAGLRSHADGCDPKRPWASSKAGSLRSRSASVGLADYLCGQRKTGALGFEVVDRCVHFRQRL
jgi:aminoglycoside 6'-N-acetyltransferase I